MFYGPEVQMAYRHLVYRNNYRNNRGNYSKSGL